MILSNLSSNGYRMKLGCVVVFVGMLVEHVAVRASHYDRYSPSFFLSLCVYDEDRTRNRKTKVHREKMS